VVVLDRHIQRPVVLDAEGDAPLVVDPDGASADPISLETLEPAALERAQVALIDGSLDPIRAATRRLPGAEGRPRSPSDACP